MRKYVSVLLIFTLSLIVFLPKVNAADVNYDDTTCNYTSKAYVNKLAYNVTTSYEIITTEDNSYYLELSIYNIVDDIYVTIKNENDKNDAGKSILPSETKNGVYTIRIDDVSNVETYNINVRTLKFGCTSNIRSFSWTKPKLNTYSRLIICKESIMQDYYYCQKWITQDFPLKEDVIMSRINKEYQNRQTTTTTVCTSCELEEKNDKELEFKRRLKNYIIIGLIVGIIIDLFLLVIQIVLLKKGNIYE